MKISRLRPAIMLGATLFACSLGQAAIVQYTTTGLFDGVSSTKTIGTVTLEFLGATGPANANPATFASLGKIRTTGGAATANLAGITLAITVTQTAPGAGSDVFNATLSGTISGSSSTAIVNFGGIQFVTIGAAQYQNNDDIYELVPQSAGGETTIQGRIDVVPEPSTTLLLGTGFGLIALIGSKFRKKVQQ